MTYSSDRATDQLRLSAKVSSGVSTLKTDHAWSQGRIYGAVKRWSGADSELSYRRQNHTLTLILRGRTDLTGARMSGSPLYEGRDGSGCISFVPAGAEKSAWYRNANLTFIAMEISPDFFLPWNLGLELRSLQAFTNRRDSLLESLLSSLSSEMENGAAALPSLYVEHAAGMAMARLMRSAHRALSRKSSRAGLSGANLRLVLEFIEENLHRDLSLSDLGALVGMGPDVFARSFRIHEGVPPYRYLMRRRMRRAEVLLASKDASIAEIALAVGFSSQSHFTTHFSKLLNVTPAAYRARQRG